MHLSLIALLALSAQPDASDVGPLVLPFWLVQQRGMPEATNPANDQRVKAVLSKALAKDGVITLAELGGLMSPEMFNKLAGSDAILDTAEIERAVEAAAPESRNKLAPKLREHADYLTTTFDMIDEHHRDASAEARSVDRESLRARKTASRRRRLHGQLTA